MIYKIHVPAGAVARAEAGAGARTGTGAGAGGRTLHGARTEVTNKDTKEN